MRKLSLILAVLVLTAPAWARVDIICVQTDSNEATVSYNVTVDEPNKVRAFALDIVLDNDANIIEVDTSANVHYTIFPGSVVISGGEITDEGQAVADPCDYPEDTQPGPNSPGVTIEMGALYSPPTDDSPNAPPDNDVLLKFYFDNDCNVTITENDARGGVVLTDPNEEIGDFNAPVVHLVIPSECLVVGQWKGGNLITQAMYDKWVIIGKPDCWCYDCHWRADSDGDCDVDYPDVIVAIAGWDVYANGFCADTDNDGDVDYPDIIALIDGWNLGCIDTEQPEYPNRGSCTPE